jgi:outer membrane protein TolC
LTINECVQLALANNRRIQARYGALDRAAARRLESRLLKNPEADGSVIISEEDSDDYVIEMGVEMDVLDLILLPKRRQIGQSRYEEVRMDVAGTVQTLAYETRIAYFKLLAAEQHLEMRQTILKAAEAADEMSERLHQAGNIRVLDRLSEQALLEQARLGVSAAELAVIESRENLNVLMGLSGPDLDWELSGEYPEPGEAFPDAEAIEIEAVDNSVQLAIAAARIRAAAERLGIVRVESAIPALHMGVDAEREPDGVWLVGPMISVELPIFDFGQASRPAAEAELRRLGHEYGALAIEITAAARKAAERAAISARRAQQYRQTIVPLQEKITHRTQLQYNAMQLGVFQLLQAKQMEIAIRSSSITEQLNYWIARTELEQIRNGLLVNASGMERSAGSMTMQAESNGGH